MWHFRVFWTVFGAEFFQHSVSEKFLLLVACNKQDVKIYNLNDWRFEESKVQFTEGAFSRGVARMRSYEEAQQSYLGRSTFLSLQAIYFDL